MTERYAGVDSSDKKAAIVRVLPKLHRRPKSPAGSLPDGEIGLQRSGPEPCRCNRLL
jgi:hypothetical protein